MMETVVTLASNVGHEAEENTIGTLSKPEAKEALRKHKGNIWAAVTECVEQRQLKVSKKWCIIILYVLKMTFFWWMYQLHHQQILKFPLCLPAGLQEKSAGISKLVDDYVSRQAPAFKLRTIYFYFKTNVIYF